MNLTDRVISADDAVARTVGGEVVLLNLSTGLYYGLDQVGGLVWRMIDEQGPLSLAEIRTAITETYEVDDDTAAADLLAVATDLASAGLIETFTG